MRDARGGQTFVGDVVRLIDPERDRAHGLGTVTDLHSEREITVQWTKRGPHNCNPADIEHVYP